MQDFTFLCVLWSNQGTEIVKIYLSCLLKCIQKINKISNVIDVKMLSCSRAIERVKCSILYGLFMTNTYSRLETVHKSIKKEMKYNAPMWLHTYIVYIVHLTGAISYILYYIMKSMIAVGIYNPHLHAPWRHRETAEYRSTNLIVPPFYWQWWRY